EPRDVIDGLGPAFGTSTDWHRPGEASGPLDVDRVFSRTQTSRLLANVLGPQLQELDQRSRRKVWLHQLAGAGEGSGRLELVVDEAQQHRPGRNGSIVERRESLDRVGVIGSGESKGDRRHQARSAGGGRVLPPSEKGQYHGSRGISDARHLRQ